MRHKRRHTKIIAFRGLFLYFCFSKHEKICFLDAATIYKKYRRLLKFPNGRIASKRAGAQQNDSRF
jgi:hypothetical protein